MGPDGQPRHALRDRPLETRLADLIGPVLPLWPASPETDALVDDLAPCRASSDPRHLTAMNWKLFSPPLHRVPAGSSGRPTAPQGHMLTHVAGPDGADPQDLTVADDVLFFSARDPARLGTMEEQRNRDRHRYG